RIPESVWRTLLRQLAMPFHTMNSLKIYLADSFPVPLGSIVYGDKAYNAYNIEDDLEQSDVHLNPIRKKNSKRKYEAFIGDGIKSIRKRIESALSVITQRFPAHIHAVTSHGFELKVFLFILAYGIEKTML
ncbi:MAG TPA: hypothetical protein VLS94_01955, partial [Fusibacter sp.]|nr:hypothetical protein [Fusibacter sp.]